jgi:hypothetical protein
MTRALGLFCVLGAGLLGAGCTGNISDGDGTAPPGGPGQPGGPGGPVTSGPAAQPGAGALGDSASVPGPAPVRRLTRLEYDNTVRDLLGVSTSVSKDAQLGDSDSSNAGFARGGSITGGDDARNLMVASAAVSETLLPRLASILPCSPLPTAAADQDACAARFITQFGKRAYRRPLTPRETDVAKALYQAQRGPEVGASFEKAMVTLIGAFIQAPQFLYHWELGGNAPIKDGALIRYNGYEIAARLSYFFWTTMPDDKLFAAADADALKTPEQIALQARRLLADERARQGLTDFHLQWLEIGNLIQTPKDDSVKNFSPAVAQSMLNETRDFVSSVFQGAKATGSLETLLTSSSSVIDGNLAKIYGTGGGGADPQPVSFDPAQRSGILTQAAFLTAHADTGDSHPIKRGDTLLRRMLCMEFKIPDMVPPVADAMPGGATTRERFTMHSMMPCATCHQLIDPVGFSFEGYDTVGAFRTTDQGKPVDTTGTVTLGSSGTTLKFKNAVELIGQLVKFPEVQDCLTTQWMRYMLGRREVAGEAPSAAAVKDLFRKSNFDFRELLVDLTRTRSFTHRSVSAGEVIQ